MKRIIGYKFVIIEDNGDSNEWWREFHIESPIYISESEALKAIQMCKRKMLAEAKEENNKYIRSQIKCEISNNRNVNRFLGLCQQALMNQYRSILKRMSCAKIEHIYGYDAATSNYKEWSIAD